VTSCTANTQFLRACNTMRALLLLLFCHAGNHVTCLCMPCTRYTHYASHQARLLSRPGEALSAFVTNSNNGIGRLLCSSVHENQSCCGSIASTQHQACIFFQGSSQHASRTGHYITWSLLGPMHDMTSRQHAPTADGAFQSCTLHWCIPMCTLHSLQA
jgi:hypothetical protein